MNQLSLQREGWKDYPKRPYSVVAYLRPLLSAPPPSRCPPLDWRGCRGDVVVVWMAVQDAPEHLLGPGPSYRHQSHAAQGLETVGAAAKPGQPNPFGETWWIGRRIRSAEAGSTDGVVGGGLWYMWR